jgi:hypothetical protein
LSVPAVALEAGLPGLALLLLLLLLLLQLLLFGVGSTAAARGAARSTEALPGWPATRLWLLLLPTGLTSKDSRRKN